MNDQTGTKNNKDTQDKCHCDCCEFIGGKSQCNHQEDTTEEEMGAYSPEELFEESESEIETETSKYNSSLLGNIIITKEKLLDHFNINIDENKIKKNINQLFNIYKKIDMIVDRHTVLYKDDEYYSCAMDEIKFDIFNILKSICIDNIKESFDYNCQDMNIKFDKDNTNPIVIKPINRVGKEPKCNDPYSNDITILSELDESLVKKACEKKKEINKLSEQMSPTLNNIHNEVLNEFDAKFIGQKTKIDKEALSKFTEGELTKLTKTDPKEKQEIIDRLKNK